MAQIELSSLVKRQYAEDEEKPVMVQKEEKTDNCFTFTVYNEDHTLGNMLTDQLLTESRIRYAGYRIEHPTKDLIKIRIQSASSPTISHPSELVDPAINDLCTKLSSLSTAFKEACKQYDEHNQG